MKNIFAIVSIAFFFCSCEKDELPVEPHSAGSAFTSAVDMNADYKYQVYFDLETNRMVGQCLKSSWDIGFEADATGFHVIVNSAKSMFAWNTGDTSFVSLTDTAGFAIGKMWDAVSGTLDSTAVGDWTSGQHTYILDRGYNELGLHQGFRKVRFESVSSFDYTLRFANMDGSGEVLMTIPKDTTFNFTFLSFANGGQLMTVEPPKRDWDLVFTQYIHIFHDPVQPYLVTGCLLNRYQTSAARDTVMNFNDITFQSLSNFTLYSAINTIGYDWKNFNGTSYITDPSINYLILDQHGFFYKLHFIDFYNQSGIKGNPKWEFQRL